MPSSDLERAIKGLEERLVSGNAIGPSHDIPFALFVYKPADEIELRRQVSLMATRVTNAGRPVHIIDLGDLMWECFAEHPLGGLEGLFKLEEESKELEPVLKEARQLLIGTKRSDQPGPLERRVLAGLQAIDPKREIAFLVRAGELFPIYRTSALLERLIGIQDLPPAVLFYPGTVYGTTQPSFMGVCEPSPRYRVEILDHA